MGLFERKKEKERKSHFKNLVVLAAIDGKIDEREKELLYHIGRHWGLRLGEVSSVITEIFSKPEKIKFVPPKNTAERIEQLFDLIYMMLIDGVIDEREFDFCTVVSVKMGFPPSMVHRIVTDIIEKIKEGATKEEVKKVSEDLGYIV